MTRGFHKAKIGRTSIVCKKCEVDKALTEYYKYRNVCKKCYSRATKVKKLDWFDKQEDTAEAVKDFEQYNKRYFLNKYPITSAKYNYLRLIYNKSHRVIIPIAPAIPVIAYADE